MSQNGASLVLRSRRVVTPLGVKSASLHIVDGRIAEIGPYDPDEGQPFEGTDFGDLVILPGLVDPHVHLNEPGRTDWEGFATGTAAAAAGGVTTLIDMPLNSSPVTTSVEALVAKRLASMGKLSVDVGFHAGLVPGNEGEIEALLDAGCRGVKAFLCHSGIDDFPAATERELSAVMPLLAERGIPLLAHAEVVHEVPAMADPRRYADYLASRPVSFERDAIKMLLRLCVQTSCPTHIVHLADAGSLPAIYEAKVKGRPLTVETCPHYLTFAAEEIADGATAYKCAPPIRDAANREGLWAGLAEGTIDFIATDHSPCPPDMKRMDEGRFDLAWGGISSLQLALPAVWTEASKRGHTLWEVANWLSHRPGELVGIKSGIEEGAEANLVVFDPDAVFTVVGAELLHRHKVTPYEGRTLRGVVKQVFLRGEAPEPGKGHTV